MKLRTWQKKNIFRGIKRRLSNNKEKKISRPKIGNSQLVEVLGFVSTWPRWSFGELINNGLLCFKCKDIPSLMKEKTTRYELLMILAFRKLIYSSLVEIWKKTRSITQYGENEPGNSACLQQGFRVPTNSWTIVKRIPWFRSHLRTSRVRNAQVPTAPIFDLTNNILSPEERGGPWRTNSPIINCDYSSCFHLLRDSIVASII